MFRLAPLGQLTHRHFVLSGQMVPNGSRKYSPDLLQIPCRVGTSGKPTTRFYARVPLWDKNVALPLEFLRLQISAEAPVEVYQPFAVITLSTREGAGSWMYWRELTAHSGQIVWALTAIDNVTPNTYSNQPLHLVYTLSSDLWAKELATYGKSSDGAATLASETTVNRESRRQRARRERLNNQSNQDGNNDLMPRGEVQRALRSELNDILPGLLRNCLRLEEDDSPRRRKRPASHLHQLRNDTGRQAVVLSDPATINTMRGQAAVGYFSPQLQGPSRPAVQSMMMPGTSSLSEDMTRAVASASTAAFQAVLGSVISRQHQRSASDWNHLPPEQGRTFQNEPVHQNDPRVRFF